MEKYFIVFKKKKEFLNHLLKKKIDLTFLRDL